MILKVLDIHDDLFNDYTFHYKVITKSNKLCDVLEEILDYTEMYPDRFKPLNEIVYKDDVSSNRWGIYIDGMIYESTWGHDVIDSKTKKWKKLSPFMDYYEIPNFIKVKSVTAIGNGKRNKGINFYIITEKGYER